ncbi:MAG: hypothetical protein COB30_017495 [Ectothiorhodospiraceae bacterium]|nr:hypothetical protein [Ectothiorhodospiraceae bacterium]
MKFFIILISSLLLTTSNVIYAEADKIVILVNQELSDDYFSKRTLKKIFLGRKQSNHAGVSISPCYLDTTAVKNSLYSISNKSPASFRSYWNKRLFSGAGSSPKTFSDIGQLYRYMSIKKGAVCLAISDKKLPDSISETVIKQ